jgi:TonB family protein
MSMTATNASVPSGPAQRGVWIALMVSMALHLGVACFCAFAPAPPTLPSVASTTGVELDSVFVSKPVPAPEREVKERAAAGTAHASAAHRRTSEAASTGEVVVPQAATKVDDVVEEGSDDGEGDVTGGGGDDGKGGSATNDSNAPTTNAGNGPSGALGARALLFAAFMRYLKHAVLPKWHPAERAHRLDPEGHAIEFDRNTLLDVVVDAEGRISAIAIKRSCGFDFLDDEAIAAFRRTAPLHKPPTAILEGDGRLHFTFGFHIDNTTRITRALPP